MKLSDKPKESITKKPDSATKNVLMGIVETPQGKLAIIDGQRLKIGNRINGYQVRAIYENSVVLAQSGKTKKLQLAPTIKSQGN